MLRKAATGSAKNITPKREKAASNDAGANGNTWASPWTKRSPWCPEFLRWATSDRKSTRLNSSHSCAARMPSSAGKKTNCPSEHKMVVTTNKTHYTSLPQHTGKIHDKHTLK